MNRSFDLEDRLVRFAADMIIFTGTFPTTYPAIKLSEQLSRASLSSALNYGEVQAAESSRDFRHKNAIVLKELKECRVGLKITQALRFGDELKRPQLLDEVNQLAAIFATIIKKTST